MKWMLLFPALLLLAACTPEPLNETQAKEVAEALLNTLAEKKYDAVSAYCTASFNTGESVQKRSEKYRQLSDVLGTMQEFSFVSAEHITQIAEPAYIVLVYRVVYAHATTQETFTIRKEDGAYKVADHNIRTENTL